MAKVKGSIKFNPGSIDPGSVSVPTKPVFSFSIDTEDLNIVTVRFTAQNFDTLTLIKTSLGPSKEQIRIDVSKLNHALITKNILYKTQIQLEATNKNGTTLSDISEIDVAYKLLDKNIIESFSASRVGNSYEKINLNLKLKNQQDVPISDLSYIKFYYRRADQDTWKTENLSLNYIENKDSSGLVVSYEFSYEKTILRESIGGYFVFKIEIDFKDHAPMNTVATPSVYFPDLSFDSSSVASLSNLPGNLRYEITNSFLEQYVVFKQGERKEFKKQFLDSDKVYNLSLLALSYQKNIGGDLLFPFEIANNGGYLFPACVSDILPCITINKMGSVNNSLVLFWKINDNFFDYSFFKDSIFIKTTGFKIKIQYKGKNDSSYTDLTKEISLTEEKNYDSSSNKFILSISKNDLLAGASSKFQEISEADNYSNALKIKVVSHSVQCYWREVSSASSVKDYTFTKLLIPNKWKYICYDQYIPSRLRDSDKISVFINDPTLRGIVLPEEGFSKFLNLDNLTVDSAIGDGATSTDFKILYKISSEINSFHLDPVIEGTVNAVELPYYPDDVFLISPSVNLPDPNLVKIGEGGRKAEAIVNLDEYGKISNIQVIDPGEGYSFYSTQQIKREQTFTDFTPAVQMVYTIVGADIGINNQKLDPKNLLIDRSNLLASLVGGVRLASVSDDIQKLGGQDSLSEEAKVKINNYLQRDTTQEVILPIVTSNPYGNKSDSVNENSIGVVDEIWDTISRLYDKFNNPLDNSNIYNLDIDAGASDLKDSSISPSASSSNSVFSVAAASSNPDSPQESDSEIFTLNNLNVIPDGSAAMGAADDSKAPPWLTLEPTSVRPDGAYAFGVLPNMLPRAETFNRLCMGINNLNQVRLIAPFVWNVNTKKVASDWYSTASIANIENKIQEFSKVGTKVDLPTTNTQQELQPINSFLSASTARSIGIIYTEGSNKLVSSEFSEDISFKPSVHPLMNAALPQRYLRSIKRKFLGVITETTTTCAFLSTDFEICNGPNGNYEKPLPKGSEIPFNSTRREKRFEFFDYGSTINTNPQGTAKFLQLNPVIGKNDYGCNFRCGDSYKKDVDFQYTNMFPAIIELK